MSYWLLFISQLRSGYLCESRSLVGTRTRVEDPDLSEVVWGGGVKISPLPDYIFYSFLLSTFSAYKTLRPKGEAKPAVYILC